eukprot:c4540_g1_i1.p1 GENE.c4540_g1_i1~~c4540_g1_i1.p1  ORF type:complete len:106 (-),score=22.14 c4540_g1_i1:257-574(-)
MACLFREDGVKPADYIPKLQAKLHELDHRITLLGNTAHDEHVRQAMQHKIAEINAVIKDMEKLDPEAEVPKPILSHHQVVDCCGQRAEVKVTPRTLAAMNVQYMT